MFSKEDLENFPWQVVKKIVFYGLKITIHFNSGNGLEATAPDLATVEQLKKDANTNLRSDQIEE